MPRGIYKRTPEHIQKLGLSLKGNSNGFQKGYIPHNYKGETARYETKHQWVYYHYGKAKICENKECKYKNPKKYHWANISGKYKRDRKDWIQLCPSCHKRMDYKPKTHCVYGHKLEGENLWINNRGNRVCKKCKAVRAKRNYEKDRQKVIDRVTQWRKRRKLIHSTIKR